MKRAAPRQDVLARTGARTAARIGARVGALASALIVGLWLGTLAPSAEAQPRPAAQPTPRAAPSASSKGDRRAEIKRKLMAFRAYRVTEELALDETAAARVFPLLSKYDQKVEQLTAERIQLNKELRNPPVDAKAIDDLIRRAQANRRAMLELDEQRLSELRKVLSAAQTARLLVVLPEIERQIKAQIRRSLRQQDGDPLNPFPRKRGRKALRQSDDFDEVE